MRLPQKGRHSGNGGAKSPPPSDIRDDPEFLFLMCAAVAWTQIYEETGQWPPDSAQTKRRAYQLYETEKRKAGANP